MLVVIVTGGRGFGEVPRNCTPANQPHAKEQAHRERVVLGAELDALLDLDPDLEIHQGECPTGADKWARVWCRRRGVRCRGWWAAWRQHGNSAGPMRNTEMVRGARASVCMRFPGGDGTADCARKARAAGMRMIEIEPVSKAKTL